jgi:RND family efflux transporter MFP subunit
MQVHDQPDAMNPARDGDSTEQVSPVRPQVPSPAATPEPTVGSEWEEHPASNAPGPKQEQAARPASNSLSTVQEQPATISPPATPFPGSPNFSKSSRQRPSRFVILVSILGLIVLLGGTFYYIWKLVGPPDVTLYRVSTGQVTLYVGGGGVVFPLQQLNISYPSAERVLAVLVKPGDAVSPNQSLVRLDPSQLNAQIQLAANDVAAAQSFLNSVSAAGNSLQIAQAQQALSLAKNRYNALIGQASSLTLHNGNLISPIKGIVTSVNINPGEVFAANTVLLTVMDESVVIVHAKVPLSDLKQVQLGQSATVSPSALPTLHARGTVSAVIPVADPQTDTFEVWVEVVNTDGSLLPGMSAFVNLQDTSQAFIIPRLAVLNPDQDSAVFVVRNNHAYLQRVHIIGRSVDSIYIDAGIAASDEVVLVGLDSLQNGQQVNVTGIENQAP